MRVLRAHGRYSFHGTRSLGVFQENWVSEINLKGRSQKRKKGTFQREEIVWTQTKIHNVLRSVITVQFDGTWAQIV